MERTVREATRPAGAPERWTARQLLAAPDGIVEGRWTLHGRAPDFALMSPGSNGRRLFGWGSAFVLEANGGSAILLDGTGTELANVVDRGPLEATARLWQEWSKGYSLDCDLPAPMAVGAFAFDLGRPPSGAWSGAPPLRLTVPAASVLVQGDETWFVTVSPAAPGGETPRFQPATLATGRSPEMRQPPLPLAAEWSPDVGQAMDAIRSGRIRKVVLAQELVLPLDRPLDPELAMERLRAAGPESWTFRIPVVGGRVFVGSSPELLLRGTGQELESWPLAGTLSTDGEEPTEVGRRLSVSDKNLREHHEVVDQVGTVLRGYCQDLSYPGQPEPVLIPGMVHLGTRIRGVVKTGTRAPVLEVLARLHPTPAVAGTPVGPAMALIRELEPFDRGWWAGGVGWVDATGAGEFALAIRSALVTDAQIHLFAGGGWVAGSDPVLERAELELKFRSVLRPLLGTGRQLTERGADRLNNGAASRRAGSRREADRK